MLSIEILNLLSPKEIFIGFKGQYFFAADFLTVFSFLLYTKQQRDSALNLCPCI